MAPSILKAGGRNMKIGIIGVGNIGSIIARRLVEGKVVDPEDVILSNRSKEKLVSFQKTGYAIADTNEELCDFSDVIFLCVKPQDSLEMFSQIRKISLKQKIIISTMTAVSIERIKEETKCEKIVRIMPNVPAMIGKGVIGMAFSSNISSDEKELVKKLVSTLGFIIEVREKDFAAVTALSGSGPAFVFVIVEALIDAGLRMGVSYEKARVMILETLKGSAELLKVMGNHPGEFRHLVTSPAGTTIEGIYTMEREGIRGALMKTIHEAFLRALKLEEELKVG